MNLVDRAKNLIVTPKTEWSAIDAESHTVQGLYTGYVMILAAIPAIATFIGTSLVGVGFLGTTYRVPITAGVAQMILSYVLSLGVVYVVALIIDALAPNFGGQKNFMQAFKVAAFAPTASWLAGIFSIIPVLSILGIVGLYSLYLLYLGLPRLMKAPEDKAIPYTVVVIIVVIVLFIVVFALSALVVPTRMRGF
jgi:Yip1-like protein